MEKKNCGRSTQSAPEGRKTADSSSSNRYNRRRESSGSKNGNSDAARKPSYPASRGKFVDKRPRPRGQYYGGGKQETKVEEFFEGPEDGSVGTCGRKKQNLNHLLNFTLAPRPAMGSGSSSLQQKHPTSWLATHKHKYNKEEFLQANCQFVVKSGIDYSPYMVDPDILVDWSYIEQIRLRSTELLACPICLDSPVAAKMTRCGHVYCWPCILHYLALSDKSWRKCPICYESVHKKDLKSVATISEALSTVGQKFTLKLMKRDRSSLLAVPLDECDSSRQSGVPMSVSETKLNIAFSKLLLADCDDVKAVTGSELDQLQVALKAAEHEPEACFIEQALDLLGERAKSLQTQPVEPPIETSDTILPHEKESLHLENVNVVADPFADEGSNKQDSSDEEVSHGGEEVAEDNEESLINVAPEDVETESQISGQKPFYFYQAADGQNVFLTALNLRMLEMQYGCLAQAPFTITGTVLEKETGSMTRELRNRLRSLSHLPITAAFELLELDLSTMVSREVMSAFAEPLRMRAEKRRRRERDERRRDRKITQQVELQWGQRPGHRMRLDSARHFPKCGEEEPIGDGGDATPTSMTRSNSYSSIGSASHPDISEPTPNALMEVSYPALPAQEQSEAAGPSFAQMLKDGAKPVGWGSGGSAWGRRQPSNQGVPLTAAVAAEPAGEDSEYGAPQYHNSFSDAIAKALDNADFSLGEAGKGKKKKRKQKLLFSTGMSFASK